MKTADELIAFLYYKLTDDVDNHDLLRTIFKENKEYLKEWFAKYYKTHFCTVEEFETYISDSVILNAAMKTQLYKKLREKLQSYYENKEEFTKKIYDSFHPLLIAYTERILEDVDLIEFFYEEVEIDDTAPQTLEDKLRDVGMSYHDFI